MKKAVLLSVHMLAAVWAWAAAPVGQTVWLHNDSTGSYVGSNGVSLVADNITVGNALNFVVEDAPGPDSSILLRVAGTGIYVEVDTADGDILKTTATGADTNNTLTHFTWTGVSNGFALASVGNTDGSPFVGIQGAIKPLKAKRSTTTGNPDTLFTYGVVGDPILVPPTGLSAAVSGSQVVLDWDNDFTGMLDFYRVYRSAESGTNYVAIATNLTESTYTEGGLSIGTTNYYVVTMVDTNGAESAFSNEVEAESNELLPIDSLVFSVDDESVILDWDDETSRKLDFYRVYRSDESGTNYVVIASNVTENTFADVGLTGGVTYYYVVTKTHKNGDETAFSNEIAAVPNAVVRLQHLDASDPASVLTSGGVVTQWVDQTTGGNDAFPRVGNALYPGVSLFDSGLAGVNLQSGLNSLELFSTEGSDAWLDQSGGSNGFCVLVALKCDSVLAGGNDVLGNSAFGLGFDGTGQPQAWLGGQSITSSSSRNVESGDTLILALNYDAATGAYEFWDSKNSTSTTGTVAAADFSTAEPVPLGSAASAARYLDGLVGEVKVFGSPLSPIHFERQRIRLMGKWFNRPNIVLIYMDDWAWNGTPIRMDDRMLNSGMPSLMEMPNLESMAQNGMVFRNAYGSPQCTPARASIQTGQSNPRNGMTVYMGNSGYYDDDSTIEGNKYYNFPVIANGADYTLRPEAVTIPEALAPLGYVSAHIGKWHMRGDPGDEGYIRHDGPTTNDEGNNYDDATGLAGLEDPKLMTQITDDGIAFMEEQVAAGQPFFLQLSHYAMHGGWECTPESRARYQNHPAVVAHNDGETDPALINHKKDPAVFLGMAYELDLKIGEVRQKLVDLGIADNTYVIMAGDNGYRHDFYDELSGLSQPLHMRKWWAWQAGIRVPMVVEGPGIPSGSFAGANVANYDFLPTFVEWAGGDPARVPDLDGVSLAGLMEGETPSADFLDRSLYFHYPHYRNTMPHSVMVKGQEAVVYFYETPVRFPTWEPIMYFDIGNDPGQYHNIYPDNPDRAEALYADMTNYFDSVGARIPQVPNPNYVESVYTNAKEYAKRLEGGPFIGTRAADNDESGPTTFAEYWMDSWGVDIGSSTNDFDGDGVDNLAEYALGGDPTDGLDPGSVPVLKQSGDGFIYTYMMRNDDSGLRYAIESTTNLVSGIWTNAGYTVDGVGRNAGTFDAITNVVPASDDDTFIRLKVDRK